MIDQLIATCFMNGLKLDYSTNINHALELVEKLNEMNFKLTKNRMDDYYIAYIGSAFATDREPARAIAKAVLRLRGYEL